jgi:hypothetical protein
MGWAGGMRSSTRPQAVAVAPATSGLLAALRPASPAQRSRPGIAVAAGIIPGAGDLTPPEGGIPMRMRTRIDRAAQLRGSASRVPEP